MAEAERLLGLTMIGILAGGVYGLLAVGLSLQIGVCRVLNITHGEFLMLGGVLTFTFAELEAPARPNPGPAEKLDSKELTEAVRRSVMRLPDRERAAVTLCELQELSLAEAAAVLGWRVTRLKSVLFRARGRLKKDLAAYMA